MTIKFNYVLFCFIILIGKPNIFQSTNESRITDRKAIDQNVFQPRKTEQKNANDSLKVCRFIPPGYTFGYP